MQAGDPAALMPFRQMHFSKGPAKAFWSHSIFSYRLVIICSYFVRHRCFLPLHNLHLVWIMSLRPTLGPWLPPQGKRYVWGGREHREKWEKHFAPRLLHISPVHLWDFPLKEYQKEYERGERSVQYMHSLPSRATSILKLSEEQQLFCFHKWHEKKNEGPESLDAPLKKIWLALSLSPFSGASLCLVTWWWSVGKHRQRLFKWGDSWPGRARPAALGLLSIAN